MAKNPDDRYPSCNELIIDLEAVANGEPPLQARHKYDHALLETLAYGGQRIDHHADSATPTGHSAAVSVQWVVALGVLAAISVLVNLILVATR